MAEAEYCYYKSSSTEDRMHDKDEIQPCTCECDRQLRELQETHPLPLNWDTVRDAIDRGDPFSVPQTSQVLLRRLRKYKKHFAGWKYDKGNCERIRCAAEVVDRNYLRCLEEEAHICNRETICQQCEEEGNLEWKGETVGSSGNPQYAITDCAHNCRKYHELREDRVRRMVEVILRAEACLHLKMSGVCGKRIAYLLQQT